MSGSLEDAAIAVKMGESSGDVIFWLGSNK